MTRCINEIQESTKNREMEGGLKAAVNRLLPLAINPCPLIYASVCIVVPRPPGGNRRRKGIKKYGRTSKRGGRQNEKGKKKKRKGRNRKSTLCVKPVRSNECCSSLFLTILDTSSFRWSLVVDSNRNYTTTYVIFRNKISRSSSVSLAVLLFSLSLAAPLSSAPSRDSPSFSDFHSYFLLSLLNSFFFSFSFSFRRITAIFFFFVSFHFKFIQKRR